VLKPVLAEIGDKALAELTAADVRAALTRFAEGHSTDTISIARLGLERALRHAGANELVDRNVAALVDAPKGKPGRPSKSLGLEQAGAVLRASREDRAIRSFPGLPPRQPSLMHAYIVLCLLAGIRTEEARALRWDHVDLDGQPDADPPVPPSLAVWRSVRADDDTKTERSRRTLRLPVRAVAALREHRKHQAEDRTTAGSAWHEHGLVFTTKLGLAAPGAPVAASQQFGPLNQTDVFLVDKHGQLLVSWVDGPGNWTGPKTIPGGQTRLSSASHLAASQQYGI
jgi:integrase